MLLLFAFRYFRQRLDCLDVSIVEKALKNMRSKVKNMQTCKDLDLADW